LAARTGLIAVWDNRGMTDFSLIYNQGRAAILTGPFTDAFGA
jgi:hypothetical protein